MGDVSSLVRMIVRDDSEHMIVSARTVCACAVLPTEILESSYRRTGFNCVV